MLLCSVFAVILCTVSCYNVPSSYPKCEKFDSKCFLGLTKSFVESSLNGNEELGIGPMDPIHEDRIVIKESNVELTLTDVTITGVKDVVFNNLVITKENDINTMHYDITLPHCEITGNYKLNGELLQMQITGDGKYGFSGTDIHVKLTAEQHFHKKDGKTYLKLKNFHTSTEVEGSAHFDVDNLFGGNKELADPVLKFMNENPKVIAGLWQNSFTAASMKQVFNNYNKLLKTIPIEEIMNEN